MPSTRRKGDRSASPTSGQTKQCLECGAVRNIAEFPKNKRYKYGVIGHCWPCHYDRHNAASKKYRDTENGRRRAVSWDLKTKYGITIEQYEAMLESQGGVCAVCSKPDPGGQRLGVDHCHATGQLRALLCTLCNRGIGHFLDDPSRLEQAAAYLRRWGGE